MKWPTIEDLWGMVPLPEGYRYEMLARPVIPALMDGIRLWHPDIAVVGGSCYWQEDFYNNEVALAGEANKDVFVGLSGAAASSSACGPGSRGPTRCRCMDG